MHPLYDPVCDPADGSQSRKASPHAAVRIRKRMADMGTVLGSRIAVKTVIEGI